MIIPAYGVHPLLVEPHRLPADDPAPGEPLVAAANRALAVLSDLDFRVDEESGRAVVSVIDTPSGRVIRRLSGEETAELSQRMRALSGALQGRPS